MQFAKLVAAMAAIALGSTQALAADKPADPKDKVVKPVTSTSKPTDKGAQGGIILQNQGAKAPATAKTATQKKTTGGTQ